MVPTSFAEANAVQHPPPGVPIDSCHTLSVLMTETNDNVPVIVSCWKLTTEEVQEIQRTGRVWLVVVGKAMPPVAVTCLRPF